MSFKKKSHRIISMFCVAVLLLPMVLGLSVSAAEKRYLGYPVNLLIGEKLPVNSFVDEKGKAAKIEIAEGQYTLITYWASWCPGCVIASPMSAACLPRCGCWIGSAC